MEYGLVVPEKLTAFTKRAPIGKTLKEEIHSTAGSLFHIGLGCWRLFGEGHLLEEIFCSENRVNFSVRFVS